MKYNGGKNGNGTFQTIINNIPFHQVYLELFAGSAAVYFFKLQSVISILCDKCSLQAASLKGQIRPGDIVLNADTIQSIDFIVALGNVLHSFGIKVFMYLDPPYPFSSRRSSRNLYQHELTDEDHIALLSGIGRARFDVAISTYSNSIYSDMLSDWTCLEYQSQTRRGAATELLYMNYSSIDLLHDYRYLGKNFREREKYSRIRKNIISKLNAMDPHLLQSILNSMTDQK